MKSYLIIGMGNFGQSLAMELAQLNHEVLVIDEQEKHVAPVVDIVTDALIGDAKDEGFLRLLGIPNFDCVVVAITRLEDSIMVNMLVQEMGAVNIISKAKGELHAKILKKIGVSTVVRPEFDMGKRIAKSMDEEDKDR